MYVRIVFSLKSVLFLRTGDGHEVYLYKLQIYLNMQNIIPGEGVFFILKEKPNKSHKNKGD